MKADVFTANLERIKKALGNEHDEDEPKKRKKRTRRTSPPEKLQQADLLNVRRLLRACEDLDGLVSYDAFSDEIVLERPIPRPDYPAEEDWMPRPFQDDDATHLAETLIERKLVKAGSGLVHEVIRGIAKDVTKHPVRDYLRGLEWDGTERISRWLVDFAGAEHVDPDNPGSEDRTDYLEAVSRASLIGAVARVMVPGCKHDHCLTLIGAQNIGKSTLIRNLSPNPDWFSDSLIRDMGDKDAMVGLAGTWLVEMAELASLNKTDFATAKGFLSRQVDRFRPPYGRCDVKRPRQVAFFATTNVAEPFKDETGNRRFWPIDSRRCDPDGLAKVRNQLWAESVHFYDSGEQWWLTRDMEIVAQGEQAKRMAVHPLIPAIREVIENALNRDVIEIKTILTAWDTRKSDWNRLSQDVAKALREMGWTSARRLEDGVRAPRWYAPSGEREGRP